MEEKEQPQSNVITTENFLVFSWNLLTQLTVQKCLKPITPDLLQNCRNSLIYTKFESMTMVQNIKTILEQCHTIRKLTFIDVLIDEFRNRSSPPDSKQTTTTGTNNKLIIDHPNLTHIVIKSSTVISKKERWLLDFLDKACNFKRLQSLRIQKIYTQGSGSSSSSSLSSPELTVDFIEKYVQEIENDTATPFILRHRATLKELEIGGPGLKIQTEDIPAREYERLKSLQLDVFMFSMDGQGLPVFLKTQNRLQILTCSHIFRFDPRVDYWILSSHISDCIARNFRSLLEIKIYPILIMNSSRQKVLQDNILSMFAINCSIFEDCTSLKKLILGFYAYRQEENLSDAKLATLMGNRLTNIPSVPTQLEEICLLLEEYSRDELEIFAGSLPKFTKLKLFYFGTSQLNPVNVYLIKLVWVSSLISLPEIEGIEFHNGRLEDEDEARRIVSDVSKKFGVEITMVYNFPQFTLEITRERPFTTDAVPDRT